MHHSYEQRVCIVTGGASGLGKELCRQLGGAGALVIIADIDESRGQIAADEIAKTGGVALAIPVDVTKSHSVQSLFEKVVAQFGRIDYIFNNAGVGIWGEFRDITLDQWCRVLDVNLIGVINSIHSCYPIMLRQGFGHIVNIASSLGIIPGPLCGPYVASKFAVFGLTNALRAEARGLGIDVTVICPGFIDTDMIAKMKPINTDAEAIGKLSPVQMMDPRLAAKRILNGVARKKGIIVFPMPVRVLALVFHFFPWLFTRISLRQVLEFRKARRTPAA